MFYKVAYNQEIIDVIEDIQYVSYQPRNKMLILSDKKDGSVGFCSSNGEIYRLEDQPETIGFDINQVVKLIEIEEDEYEILKEALGLNEKIEYDEPQPEPEPEPEPPTEEEIIDQNEVNMVKSSKLKKMSNTCNSVITNGFDIVLSDGNTYHFDLTEEDQINLMNLQVMIAQGITEIPYHAKDELCRYYSVEDITAIITMATNFKTYHISYFNSLKNYINSLEDIETIGSVEYGMEIPEEYQTEVLKSLISSSEDSANA